MERGETLGVRGKYRAVVGKEGGFLLERGETLGARGKYRAVVGKEVVSSWRGERHEG